MLLIIHNLPSHFGYSDVKNLIKEKCGLQELILDNLSNEGKTKRVTVGLADEGDSILLVQKLNGVLLNGFQLYVEDVRQKKISEKSYRTMNNYQGNELQLNMQQSQFEDEINRASMPLPTQPAALMTMQPPYSMPFYMSPLQTPNVNYDKQAPSSMNPLQRLPYYQQNVSNYGYHTVGNQYQWSDQTITSYPDKTRLLANNASNTNYEQPNRNQDRKGAVGKNPYDSDVSREVNRRSDINTSGTSRQDDRDRDFRGQDRDKFDNKGFRSGKHEDKYRAHGSPSGSPDGYENRSASKHDARRNNNFDNSAHSSNFDRSGPRHRSPQRDQSFQRDRPFRRDRSPPRDPRNPRNLEVRDQQSKHPLSNFYEHLERKSFNNRGAARGSKRPYPNRSETFSNNPNNSTFTKSNVNVFGQQINTGFASNSMKRDGNFHGRPGKRAKYNTEGKNFGGARGRFDTKPVTPSENRSLTIQEKLLNHNVWRVSASKFLACEILENANVSKTKYFNQVKVNLKKCISSRIDVIIGDKVMNSLQEMIDSYREKFDAKDDVKFYKAVMEKIKRDKEEAAQQQELAVARDPNLLPPPPIKKRRNRNKKGRVMPGPSNTQIQNPDVRQAALDVHKGPVNVPADKTSARLPKYPNANKQEYKDQKNLNKMHFQNQHLYTMDEVLEEALESEISNLQAVFNTACNELPDNNHNLRLNFLNLRPKISNDFIKVTRVHLTRRVLNVTSCLTIRIFTNPKALPRAILDPFLKKQGIVTLKRSEANKMYLATCDSFATYDRLLALKTTTLDHATLSFKPLYLVGPPDKINIQRTKTNPTPSVSKDIDHHNPDKPKSPTPNIVDLTEDPVLPYNDPFVNDDTKFHEDDLDISFGDQDLVVIENKNDVVVVEDSDYNDKSEDTDIPTKRADVDSDIDENYVDETKQTTSLDKECQGTNNVQANETQAIEEEKQDQVQEEKQHKVKEENQDKVKEEKQDKVEEEKQDKVEEEKQDKNEVEKQDKNEEKQDENKEEEKDKNEEINENQLPKNKFDENILETVDVAEEDLEDF